jgi:hypothetical protein
MGSQGLAAISDNFTYANGLEGADTPATAGDSPDEVSSFRFYCGNGQLRKDDPMVSRGKPGTAHMHFFIGNTGTNAYSTYTSLSTSGGTTCGDPKYPIMRASYWAPE